VAYFAVPDAGRLVEAGTRLHLHLADTLVLEHGRALEHIDELHLAVVPVPLAVRRLAGSRPDDVRDHLAARRPPDAEVAILEVGAQSALNESGVRLVAYGEAVFHVGLYEGISRGILPFRAISD